MKYIKKPVEIEAIQWNGNNYEEIQEFTKGKATHYKWYDLNEAGVDKNKLQMYFSEGKIEILKGDYIIKDNTGYLYSCKPDIFETTYEKV